MQISIRNCSLVKMLPRGTARSSLPRVHTRWGRKRWSGSSMWCPRSWNSRHQETDRGWCPAVLEPDTWHPGRSAQLPGLWWRSRGSSQCPSFPPPPLPCSADSTFQPYRVQYTWNWSWDLVTVKKTKQKDCRKVMLIGNLSCNILKAFIFLITWEKYPRWNRDIKMSLLMG